ncbi:hypothetical protein ABB37_03475 [Leptomonas pyrrhocoris]|uniref:CCHC-type domain-containing protein n=1 Tax=Leptomonas pyrrhocoris TaxID=157538 RepID=A0A0M9G588_LEPPY|nr:hypothetical protein ABB37_03475 [Leptomonas pyrrhocoris]KPA82399.1 hypothetical protein ABB37_03475 [Leptomonas pyrrhocoris]|eukprot:XP_015660838.1 hypothetical protein ABB37_03475 [Leptomonas pyrrhocoris]
MSRNHRSDRKERRRSHRDRDTHRDRDRDRDRDHDRKRHRSRSPDHKRTRSRPSEHRKRSNKRRSSSNPEKPPVPRDFHCHICGKNHWTIDCELLKQHPGNYPMMDAELGCWQCAQRGHNASQCRIKRYLCRDCGGMHDTRDCVYSHIGEDWYEFYDSSTRHVYYVNSDESEVQWGPPTHQLDTVYWYCSHCKVMIPAKHRECLLCHAIRPTSKAEAADPTDSDSDAGGDSSSSSSSSTSTSSSSSSSSSLSGWSSVSSSSDDSDGDNDDDTIGQSSTKKDKTELSKCA